MSWSRRTFLSHLGSLVLLSSHPRAWAHEMRGVAWQTDYRRAQALRVSGHRPMLIFLTMDGCPYCQKMMHTTFEESGVASEAAKTYVMTIVNGSKQQELAKQFGVRVYPTTYLVAPDNKLVDCIEGFLTADEFRQRLSGALARRSMNASVKAR